MKKNLIRHRYFFMFGLGILILCASLYSDPDHGLSTLLGWVGIGQGIWAVLMAYWARKALLDYDEADQQSFFKKAAETSTGSGLALLSISILFVGLLMVFSPRAHATQLPEGFYKYAPLLIKEQQKYWPNHPNPALLAALIEQESCITLKSKSCWNPKARLKTTREEGAGMGQLTRAYYKDGSLRFDTLQMLKFNYSMNNELQDIHWGNIYDRPDLQLRALVLLSRDSAKSFIHTFSWLEFGDAAYNGGISGVQKERRACQLTIECDPNHWFDHVEKHCLKSNKVLYGNKSACDINREHVYNVFKIRQSKYIIPIRALYESTTTL